MSILRAYQNDLPKVITSLILLVAVLLAGDALIHYRPYFPAIYWRSLDPLVHGLAGTIILSPLASSRRDLIWFFLASTMIDLDHVVVAGSFYLEDMLALPVRPATHSITFSVIVAIIAYLISGKQRIFWIVLIAMVSHVVRDASTGITPILYPLGIDSIPYALYIMIEIALYISCLVLSRYERNAPLIGNA